MGFGQLAASRYLLPATGASHRPAVDFHEVSTTYFQTPAILSPILSFLEVHT